MQAAAAACNSNITRPRRCSASSSRWSARWRASPRAQAASAGQPSRLRLVVAAHRAPAHHRGAAGHCRVVQRVGAARVHAARRAGSARGPGRRAVRRVSARPGLLVSRFVPANRFSLHGMYRQRLVRTFLGASHADRRAERVHRLRSRGRPPGPRAEGRASAAGDQRHAEQRLVHELRAEREQSATRSRSRRCMSGAPRSAIATSSEYGSDGGGPATGLSLGMALAVSGAAASPAMGMYSSKARAFLLTLANARLGLWFGNPSDAADVAAERSRARRRAVRSRAARTRRPTRTRTSTCRTAGISRTSVCGRWWSAGAA